MMRSSVLPSAVRRAGLLTGAAVGTVILLSACSGNDSGTGMNHGDTTPPAAATSSAGFNDTDVAFAQHMIAHHQQAVQMAAVAETRASDPHVKELAADIKKAQQPEIDTMNEWLTAWGKTAPDTGMASSMPGMHSAAPSMDHSAMPGMMSDTDMAKLAQATGAAFDKQFLTMMISHHQGAITMAQQETGQGSNPEAKTLAQKIITDQQAEITTMKEILDRL